ncbi:Metalloproteases (zincins), catalytic [Glarea lozoyensis ATCC 20868]|uniref:Metalloproteases (Zincins), catalytic n=1 Tax=Glarea lozoyensis (strain ATCC 20868 / MF5171) TaxID=1116229 RepID=S3E3Z3_GLAL2|nr:Metalloproteases (zincins), catalytic [Glarea lozoyensis ATCC 20868]EPE33168.1 Metalloproteases (zincins), catalytic [Glarea lozoyensis ATCC 20868]
MVPITVLIGLFVSPIFAAALPVLERATPLSFDAGSIQEPVATAYDWISGYVSEFPIHSSCNTSERAEIYQGLQEAVLIAQHAKEHILVHGNNSELFKKYFGAGPTGPVLGWYDKIATANRAGVLFRCDDPDQNCATQDNWAGHWRGSNATSETVICELSYTTRWPLAAMCARGFDVATGRTSNYWAGDLMHRLYHTDIVGEGLVEHHADGYHGCVELAAGENYTLAASNSATLSYFAIEAYAYDIAVPGEGCLGKPVEKEDDGHGHGAASSSSSSSMTESTTSSTTATAAPASTTSINPTRVVQVPATTSSATLAQETAGKECHTHADGTLHCV